MLHRSVQQQQAQCVDRQSRVPFQIFSRVPLDRYILCSYMAVCIRLWFERAITPSVLFLFYFSFVIPSRPFFFF